MTLELLEDEATGQSRFKMISAPGGLMRSMEGVWAVQASPDRSGVLTRCDKGKGTCKG
jgi:hypothetical protein